MTNKIRRVLIQVPEGLKKNFLETAKEFKKLGYVPILSADACYGARDTADAEAKKLGCAKIVHYGHSDFGVKTEVPVEYREYRIGYDPTKTLQKFSELFKKFDAIGLITTVQYLESLEAAKEFFEEAGKKVVIGKSIKKCGAKHAGQILGCDTTAATSVEDKADCFLFIGSGKFHYFGINTKKPVFILDVEKNSISQASNNERLERQRYARIAIAKGCKRFGILISTKPGQMNIELAIGVMERIEKSGREAFIVAADEFSPENLLGMDFDCYVNCACPRLTDDSEKFGKHIVNPEDLE